MRNDLIYSMLYLGKEQYHYITAKAVTKNIESSNAVA